MGFANYLELRAIGRTAVSAIAKGRSGACGTGGGSWAVRRIAGRGNGGLCCWRLPWLSRRPARRFAGSFSFWPVVLLSWSSGYLRLLWLLRIRDALCLASDLTPRAELEEFDFVFENLFDGDEVSLFFGTYQGDGFAFFSGTSSTADTVDVVFGNVGQLEVDDVGKVGDIDTAGSYIGCDKHANVVGLEILEGALAGGLALVAVDCGGGDAVGLELLGEPIGPVLGASEDEDLFPVAVFDEGGEGVVLVLLADGVCFLSDHVHSRVARGDFDFDGIAQNGVGQLLDVFGVGRGEEKVLAFVRQELEDLADVVDEAHVEHAVGFVEHEGFDGAEISFAALAEIEQAARGRDDDVESAAQLGDLRVDVHAAEEAGGVEAEAVAVVDDALVHLGGEFTSWGEDEGAGALVFEGRLGESLQERQAESGCLAGSGLGSSEDVSSFEDGGDGFGLDGRWLGVAFCCDGSSDFRTESESCEWHMMCGSCGSRPHVLRTLAPIWRLPMAYEAVLSFASIKVISYRSDALADQKANAG